MSNTMTSNWYEIGVLDYSHARLKKRTYIPPGSGFIVQGEEYGQNGSLYVRPTPNKMSGKIDVTTGIPFKVIFRRAKNQEKARQMGEKVGSVQFCRKVSALFKAPAIEYEYKYLELNQKPVTVTITEEDKFVLNAKGELTLAQKGTKDLLEQKYEVPIDLS